MELNIYEYNVTPNLNERDPFNIQLLDNILRINGKIIEDVKKTIAIVNLLEEYKSDIILIASERAGNYKGGRQKCLTVKFETDGEIYRVIGNTPSQDMANLYSKIKEKMIKIIEQQ